MAALQGRLAGPQPLYSRDCTFHTFCPECIHCLLPLPRLSQEPLQVLWFPFLLAHHWCQSQLVLSSFIPALKLGENCRDSSLGLDNVSCSFFFSSCLECSGFKFSEAIAPGDRQEKQEGECSGFRDKSYSTQGIQFRECGVLPPSLSLCIK